MGYTPRLKKPNIVKYSRAEQRLFALLQFSKPISTKKLIEKFYNGENVPINGRVIVTGTLRKLIEKTRHNREPFQIKCSKRSGPNPIEVWLELPKGNAKSKPEYQSV